MLFYLGCPDLSPRVQHLRPFARHPCAHARSARLRAHECASLHAWERTRARKPRGPPFIPWNPSNGPSARDRHFRDRESRRMIISNTAGFRQDLDLECPFGRTSASQAFDGNRTPQEGSPAARGTAPRREEGRFRRHNKYNNNNIHNNTNDDNNNY